MNYQYLSLPTCTASNAPYDLLVRTNGCGSFEAHCSGLGYSVEWDSHVSSRVVVLEASVAAETRTSTLSNVVRRQPHLAVMATDHEQRQRARTAAASRSQTDAAFNNANYPTTAQQARSSAIRMADAVSKAIEAFAVAERHRNFHFLARNSHHRLAEEDLSVHRAALENVEKSKSTWKVNPDHLIGSVWYTFSQQRWNITHTVPLRYWLNGEVIAPVPNKVPAAIAGIASTFPINHRNVECYVQAALDTVLDAGINVQLCHIEVMDVENTKCWMSLCAWVRKKYEWHDDRDWKQRGGRQLQLENQITWYKLNGKHFNFSALPGELRNLLYAASLGPGTDDPNTQILFVNRQIHNEAAWVWASSTKSLSLSSSFTKFNDGSIQGLPRLLSLERLRLELSAACYFELIGIHPQRGAPFAELEKDSKPIIPLKEIPDLKQLDLWFIDTTHPDAQCPWGALARQQGISAGHSCQKIWIDWFFTFAFEYLIAKKVCITMGGCIPDSVRAKWEPIFNKAQNGNTRDMVARRAAIRQAKPDDLPIKCSCIVPCSS
ncbi:hypothetical protein P171DRAFT_480593 [Karstenula rhodostoma CBS 690.94]|uniref:Uncharacterized protein n=1 Tax=Karstenula rhodostoma CBS 690.94 TaxID=1392251 RepID=A0A9P4PQM5_9PLEO|nr:hypothetical protein P171DRAFT_480593 [Karstenula rhodostoma CBS 690.94]